jgi:protein deglycase
VSAAIRSPLRCTFGFSVVPDLVLTRASSDGFDALAIPGGFEEAGFYEDAYHPLFLDLIRAFDAAAKPIAAICVGALPLARAGVLAGRRATTYHLLGGGRRQQLGDMGAVVVDAGLVVDGHLVTSTGPSTSIDVALTLLGMLTSAEAAARTRALMAFPEG